MSMLVWVMMGIAVWHFTVFVPDRFWGGILGAFLAAAVSAAVVRLGRQRTARSPARATPTSSQALVADPRSGDRARPCRIFYGMHVDRPETRDRPRACARRRPADCFAAFRPPPSSEDWMSALQAEQMVVQPLMTWQLRRAAPPPGLGRLSGGRSGRSWRAADSRPVGGGARFLSGERHDPGC